MTFTRMSIALMGQELSLVTLHLYSSRRALTVALCCSIEPLTLNELASSSPKMKNVSCTYPTTPSSGVMLIRILSPLRSQERDVAFLSLLRSTTVVRSSEEVKLSTPLSFASNWRRWRSRSLQSHTAEENPVRDEQRKTASCENHPAKGARPRDGVATSSTLFPGLLSARFPRNSKPGSRLSRMALHEPQRRGVRAEDLYRCQASRLLEERTRTTTRTMENNRENMQKVPRRSQHCLNYCYSP